MNRHSSKIDLTKIFPPKMTRLQGQSTRTRGQRNQLARRKREPTTSEGFHFYASKGGRNMMFRQTDESRIQICKVCTREAGPPLRIHPPRRTCRICPSASPRVDVFNLLSRAAAHVNLDIYSLTACKLRERGISSSVSASRACPKFRLLRESGKRRGKNEREKDLCVHFFFPSTRAHSRLEKYL